MWGLYILKDKVPIKVEDPFEWSEHFKFESRIVKQDYVGEIFVSTVFLGIDHSFGEGPPVLFETMVFGGIHDQYQDRYCTWDEAVEGHKKALKLVKDGNSGEQGEHYETLD